MPLDSLCHHHADELLVVDVTITINISLSDHLIDFLVGEFLSEVGHNVTELSGRNETVAISVEDLEGLNKLLLGVSVLHLTGHEGKELWEIDGSVTVGIDLIDHVLELSLGWVLTKGAHDSTKFLGGDGAITVLIEEGESFLELSNLFFSQIVSHSVVALILILSKFG